MVTYTDESNTQHTQLAVIGEHNIHLIEGRGLGLSKNTTPQGNASEWLKKGIFEKLKIPTGSILKEVEGL